MTPRTIDIDAVTLILERITGILSLAEDHLDKLIDLDSTKSVPLNAAIWCIGNQIEAITTLLNSGIDPKREGEPT